MPGLRLAVILPALLMVFGASADTVAKHVGTPLDEQARYEQEGQHPLPTQTLVLGEHHLEVERAVSSAERFKGLSFRRELPDEAGMLFVYDQESWLIFSMRDTLIPLSIAFIDAQRRIVDIQNMDVDSRQSYRSATPAMYALEVNQGWFADHGIVVGDTVEFGPLAEPGNQTEH